MIILQSGQALYYHHIFLHKATSNPWRNKCTTPKQHQHYLIFLLKSLHFQKAPLMSTFSVVSVVCCYNILALATLNIEHLNSDWVLSIVLPNQINVLHQLHVWLKVTLNYRSDKNHKLTLLHSLKFGKVCKKRIFVGKRTFRVRPKSPLSLAI